MGRESCPVCTHVRVRVINRALARGYSHRYSAGCIGNLTRKQIRHHDKVCLERARQVYEQLKQSEEAVS